MALRLDSNLINRPISFKQSGTLALFSNGRAAPSAVEVNSALGISLSNAA